MTAGDGELHTRNRIGEFHEIARYLRQGLDVVRRDDLVDLRRTGFNGLPLAGDRDDGGIVRACGLA